MENKFFSFIKPYLEIIDKGKLYRNPFSWLYTALAIINLFFPFYLIYQAGQNGMFDAPAKFVIVFLLVWIVVLFAGWVSFQIWWDRRKKVLMTSEIGDDFVATPVFSHLIQTIGEWLGTWIGIVGFFVALITTIFFEGYESYRFLRAMDIDFLESGIIAIIMFPIMGFLIIIATRFLAEIYRALAAIANNTRKTEEEVKTIIKDDDE